MRNYLKKLNKNLYGRYRDSTNNSGKLRGKSERKKLNAIEKNVSLSPFLSFGFSFLCPGVGQMYNSQTKLGFLFFGLNIVLLALATSSYYHVYFFTSILLVLVWFVSIFTAVKFAKDVNKIVEKDFNSFNSIPFCLILVALGSGAFITKAYSSAFQTYRMTSDGMSPALEKYQHASFQKNYYQDKNLEYGDIVILNRFIPGQGNIKIVSRVIGLPNDDISIANGGLMINGRVVTQTKINSFIENDNGTVSRISRYKEKLFGVEYIVHGRDRYFSKVNSNFKVPEKMIFYLGDDRDIATFSSFNENFSNINNISGKFVSKTFWAGTLIGQIFYLINTY